jgi:hypothetical protein
MMYCDSVLWTIRISLYNEASPESDEHLLAHYGLTATAIVNTLAASLASFAADEAGATIFLLEF